MIGWYQVDANVSDTFTKIEEVHSWTEDMHSWTDEACVATLELNERLDDSIANTINKTYDDLQDLIQKMDELTERIDFIEDAVASNNSENAEASESTENNKRDE